VNWFSDVAIVLQFSAIRCSYSWTSLRAVIVIAAIIALAVDDRTNECVHEPTLTKHVEFWNESRMGSMLRLLQCKAALTTALFLIRHRALPLPVPLLLQPLLLLLLL